LSVALCGFCRHIHHRHHNHHWHHSHWPHQHHNHHSHHRHSPNIGSAANNGRAKIAAFMATTVYKDEPVIKTFMAQTTGGTWELVTLFDEEGEQSGVQRLIAKSGKSAVVAFRGTDQPRRALKPSCRVLIFITGVLKVVCGY
jgi:hypothetical protein